MHHGNKQNGGDSQYVNKRLKLINYLDIAFLIDKHYISKNFGYTITVI